MARRQPQNRYSDENLFRRFDAPATPQRHPHPDVAILVVEGLVPHGLRHTTASLAISAGANVKVVQRMLGHATAAMTLDLYGHLLDDDLSGVADALGKAIETTAVSLRYEKAKEAKAG
jgi:integrase